MKNAVILAAGFGTRMQPLTNIVPKPLLDVNGVSLIETIINSLNKVKVDRIYIVTGYLNEKFYYLKDKYDNISFIYNKYYAKKNNIASVYKAREILKMGETFICEGDLYVSEDLLLNYDLYCSGYFGEYILGESDDWVFETDKDLRINKIKKGGINCYNMRGISYFKKEDGIILSEELERSFEKEENSDLFWDELVDNILPCIYMKVYNLKKDDIIEVDTVGELYSLRERMGK